MQHVEVNSLLADLALEPNRLARLDDDRSPDVVALRTHLAECQLCGADLESWRRTWAIVGAELQGDEVPDHLRAPAALRSKTLAMIAAVGRSSDRSQRLTAMGGSPEMGGSQEASLPVLPAEPAPNGRQGASASRRWMHRGRWMPWMAVAAALVISLGAGSLAWSRTHDLDSARKENLRLTATAATLDRVLATPAHRVVTLWTPDGMAGGTVAWSGSEIAVITTALPSPSVGQSYRCWIERDGVRTPIGPMWLSGSTGYWAGPIDGFAGLLSPGARLGVSPVPGGDGPPAPLLVGTL